MTVSAGAMSEMSQNEGVFPSPWQSRSDGNKATSPRKSRRKMVSVSEEGIGEGMLSSQ